ncbi:hypothetical protein M9H77_09646 [Catharanthus roseus]|uniref:Uncharacterized protein n=1 Tax=Catharanthus roseus TaxID=4058 RepID=A0ACC0C1C6_CATRO|nr:hypothetical protein M9H77_09646 [Catharanthus roseus]
MSCSLTPPRSNDGSAGKEDTDSTGGIGVGDATTGKLSAMKIPISPAAAGATLSGSGVLFESDMGSLRSSYIDVPSLFPVPLVPSLFFLLTHHRKVDSYSLSKIQRFKHSTEPRCSDTTCDTPNPATRSTAMSRASACLSALIYKSTVKHNPTTTLTVACWAPDHPDLIWKENMIWKNVSANAHGALRTKSGSPKRGHQNQVPASRSRYRLHIIRRLQNNRTPISLVKTGYRLLGHLPGLPWDQPQFRAPPDIPLCGRTPLQSMMRYPRTLIGPHPPWSTPLFKWIHSPESKTSTPLEEALVRGTSHVQVQSSDASEHKIITRIDTLVGMGFFHMYL